MKNLLASTLLMLLLALTASADPDPNISGYWRSDSGAVINVCYPGNPQTFVLVVDPNGQRKEYTATWMPGFRTQFYYWAGNDKIFAVHDPSTDQISLSNEAGTWSTTWRR